MFASEEPQVILVDKQDRPLGRSNKLLAHQQGLLHRAFSIFVWRAQGAFCELLIHQRAHSKYHSGGLWTNTCCSHPAPGENLFQAAQRRLMQEMGIRVQAPFCYHGSFIYRTEVGDLVEHELDHVLSIQIDEPEIDPSPEEVCDWQWCRADIIRARLNQSPQDYTCWLGQAMDLFEGKEHRAGSEENTYAAG